MPQSPLSSPDASSSLSSDDLSATARGNLGARRARRRNRRATGSVKQGDKKKVIQPSNSRFRRLLDYRTYFLLLRSTAYTPALVRKAGKMNRRLDGAFQGQVPFHGSDPLAIFTFLTTFRRACDAAGLTHSEAFPLLAFRLSGAAK